ncbi:hypothetical protein [Massilia sp. Se16.2.3]|uniref:hypothetical protein n=1 Tax=Massilia sp. Se16.2.3 TaxID=2709303 RepID=UPI001601D9FE|nr:hypothetical protein [Massilia sp. Se16.2.3]QNB00963.1 hypothetical protein G4G31_22705 [Massilia sp. Se16.2.3]
MTMQTTSSLPIQLTPGVQPQSPRMNVTPPSDGVNFSATLARQIEQRQLEGRQALAQPQAQPVMPSRRRQRAQAAGTGQGRQ